MQRLVWTNSKGDSISLTSGNFGITNWEGFANSPLNIQSQQVPFEDGSVFLDGLIENRELSVTLALNDDGDLEKRYRLRRELIQKLNPKLGEGYLVYTNDFTSKRIKCIAQIPIPENHNSNDTGTPKFSLSWTACDPYWEDLEETSVVLTPGLRKSIVNNGDVPCGVEIDLFTAGMENPEIKNFTENKKIKLTGSFSNNIKINTNTGKKSISTQDLIFKLKNLNFYIYSIAYSSKLNLFVAVGESGTILTSEDSKNWTSRTSGTTDAIVSICYSEEKELFVAVSNLTGKIITSYDGITWTIRDTTHLGLSSVYYIRSLELFVIAGGKIITSYDGITWTIISNNNYIDIAYSESLGLFVGITGSTIGTSSDGITWNNLSSITESPLYSVTYSESLGLFVAVGMFYLARPDYNILTSPDGINWNGVFSQDYDLRNVIYSEELNLFVAGGGDEYSSTILTSSDGSNWNVKLNTNHDEGGRIHSIQYIKSLGMLIAVGEKGAITTSINSDDWGFNNDFTFFTSEYITSICYSEKLNLFVAVSSKYIFTSSDGVIWKTFRPFNGHFWNICYSKEKEIFVALGVDDELGSCVGISSDGINWDMYNYDFDSNAVTYSEKLNLFVAVGYSDSVISSDGVNWTLSSSEVGYMDSICYSEEKELFVAVGDYMKKSVDGINWMDCDPLNSSLYGVTYSSKLNLFVAVGYNGKILTSPDAVTWTSRTSGVSVVLKNITYSESLGLFVAVGDNGTILTSPDGINWKNNSINLNIVNFSSIAYKNNLIILVGNNVVIYTSSFTETENLISNLTTDSDMTLSLQQGENELLLNKLSGSLSGRIKFRQKYVGV